MTRRSFMKKFLTISMLFTGLISLPLFAQDSDSAEAEASILIQAAISISQVQDLDFGMVVPGDAASAVTPTDDNAAVFEVSGEPDASYSIILPTSVDMIHDEGVGAPITVSNFTSNPEEGANGSLNGSGEQQLRVGAQHATIPSSQVSGNYSGTFTVEVAY